MRTVLTRELTQKIVHDLGRATRSLSAIAARYDVPVETVTMLRDHYGPEIPKLIDAAKALQRPLPVLPTSAEVVDVTPDPALAADVEPAEETTTQRRSDGLSREERIICRGWADAKGLPVASRGIIPLEVVTAWEQAGRPTLDDISDGVDPHAETAAWLEDYAAETEQLVQTVLELPEPALAGDELLQVAKQAAVDVVDALPYAIEHLPELVHDWLKPCTELVEAVGVDRIEQTRIHAAGQVIHELVLQGLLIDDLEACTRAARLALAAADAA
ncbi:MAG: hypothetical protein Q4F65_11265 [Propionibacteriaceae bacterium]|nr:hypothetical protein [Propionibacteriaceae bacterium]